MVPKRKRGRPPKVVAKVVEAAKPAVPLPFAPESPASSTLRFNCVHDGVGKNVRLYGYAAYDASILRFLDAMNVAPLDRPLTRLGYKFADARVGDAPNALDTCEEFDEMMKDLRVNANALAEKQKGVKEKTPTTIQIISTVRSKIIALLVIGVLLL